MTKKKAYLICPVRNCTDEQRREMDRYVEILEELGGYEFHYPPRDVDQSNDNGGVRICEEHRSAMFFCSEIHVWWDDNSSGSHFDLGMAYMLTFSKIRHNQQPLRFVIANKHEVQQVTAKSFQNVLLHISGIHKEQHDTGQQPRL